MKCINCKKSHNNWWYGYFESKCRYCGTIQKTNHSRKSFNKNFPEQLLKLCKEYDNK